MHHYINHGGSEFVVFRATPNDVTAGVRVGDRVYAGVPGNRAWASPTRPSRVAVYALLHDQDLATPMKVFATDEAGNTASADIDSRVFPKVFRRSRIDVPDTFLQRVVPAILENTPDFAREVADPNDLVAAFLKINGELRRKNAETIAALAPKSAPGMLWQGAFQQLGNSQVEAVVCRSPHVLSRRQGDRPAGAPGLRSRGHRGGAHRRGGSRQGRLRGLPRHLRQLRDRGPRPGRAVALRAPVVHRRQAGRRRGQGPADWAAAG